MENQTEEKLYTEADLVSFGKFLLSPEREKKIYDFEISGNLIADDKENTMAHHIFRSVTHAAVCNWKREQGYPTEADALDRVSVPLKNHEGHATFIGEPSQESIDAVNAMADLAYKKLK